MSPTNEVENVEISRVSYTLVMGSLMYVMICARPYVSQAIGVDNRFMVDLEREYLNID